MPAIAMRGALRRIFRFSRDRKSCLYYAACAGLLVVAAGLRFHDISEHYLWYDEAVAANISSGTLSEVISGTRCCSPSPILHPLVLYAVQKIESTRFSVRFLPATASVLVVAVMLLWLPRLGVARGAAFLAALLATLSVAAIQHAQDVREYSIDALVALLMLAGLLRYLRDGKKVLLCASLFLAPLVQYGLVLFGVAVIGAAVVAPCVAGPEGRSPPGLARRIGDWLQRRRDLAAPCGFFLAGSIVSYLATLRGQLYGVGFDSADYMSMYHYQGLSKHHYQGLIAIRHNWDGMGFGSDDYLSAYYYQGSFDAPSLFAFVIGGIGSLLTYHVPAVIAAIAALIAFALLMVSEFRRKLRGKFRSSAIAVVFSFAIAVSVGAVMLEIYPLGGIRQSIYLGPVIFLAAGVAFHWIAGCLSLLTRRAWLAPATIVAAAGAMALAGGDAIRQADLYRPHDKVEETLAVLQERAQEEDVVYVGVPFTSATMEFHRPPESEMPVFALTAPCWHSAELCFSEMFAAISEQAGKGKLWWVVDDTSWMADDAMMQLLATQVPVEHVVSGGRPDLYLIEDTDSLIKIHTTTGMLNNVESSLPREPLISSTFDMYLHEDTLFYVREPCGAEDESATFFLHVFPVEMDDLPVRRWWHGFDNLDFRLYRRGMRSAEKCVASRHLPDYPIARIRTGQYRVNEDGSVTRLWEGEVRFDE